MSTLLAPNRISEVQRHLTRTFAACICHRGLALVGDDDAAAVGGGVGGLLSCAAGVALRGELVGFALGGGGHGGEG